MPTQLKTLIAVKMPTSIEIAPKAPASNALWPEVKRWWPQAKKPTKAMPSELMAIIL